MLVTQQITWSAATWPTTTSPASQYTVLSVYPGATVALQNVSTTAASLTYDDSQNLAFQVRPSSGSLPTPTYGPEVSVFVVGYVPCRAWLRAKIRAALADRSDTGGAVLNWPDDEINGYINEALTELNLLFPAEITIPYQITLQAPTIDSHGNVAGVRDYSLPPDFFLVRSVEYVTADGKFHKFMSEKPYKGGETTATSILGYPKLGILLPPQSGRFYPGHYSIFGGQIKLDWDPVGNGDYVNLTYLGNRAYPASDADLMSVTPQDMELMNLYAQMKCWFRVTSQDSRLSRWTEGHKRDDQPILRQVDILQKIYNQRIIDRRELRPIAKRLVRR